MAQDGVLPIADDLCRELHDISSMEDEWAKQLAQLRQDEHLLADLTLQLDEANHANTKHAAALETEMQVRTACPHVAWWDAHVRAQRHKHRVYG